MSLYSEAVQALTILKTAKIRVEKYRKMAELELPFC